MNIDKETFLWHLQQLRKHLIRVVIVFILFFLVVFIFGKFFFRTIVLLPISNSLIFDMLCIVGKIFGFSWLCELTQNFQLVNINILGQFMAQIKTAFTFSLLFTIPYFLFEMWKFVKPALYDQEQKIIRKLLLLSIALFILGVLLGWSVIMPLTVFFLGNYQLDEQIANMIHIESYLSLFFVISIGTGILFLLPIVLLALIRMGIINTGLLRRYRKIVLIAIIIVIALLSPTTDAISLVIMTFPIIILYELTIFMLKKSENKEKNL